MKYTLENENTKGFDALSYIYNYMAVKNNERGGEVDNSKMTVIVNPLSEPQETVDMTDAYKVLEEGKPIFVKYGDSNEVVAFMKTKNQIISGADLKNEIDIRRKAPSYDLRHAVAVPGFWSQFLKKVFKYKTDEMKNYERTMNFFNNQIDLDNAVSLNGQLTKESTKFQEKVEDKLIQVKYNRIDRADLERFEKSQSKVEEPEKDINKKADVNKDENLNINEVLKESEGQEKLSPGQLFLKNKNYVANVITDGIVAMDPKNSNRVKVYNNVATGEVLRDLLTKDMDGCLTLAKTDPKGMTKLFLKKLVEHQKDLKNGLVKPANKTNNIVNNQKKDRVNVVAS